MAVILHRSTLLLKAVSNNMASISILNILKILCLVYFLYLLLMVVFLGIITLILCMKKWRLKEAELTAQQE